MRQALLDQITPRRIQEAERNRNLFPGDDVEDPNEFTSTAPDVVHMEPADWIHHHLHDVEASLTTKGGRRWVHQLLDTERHYQEGSTPEAEVCNSTVHPICTSTFCTHLITNAIVYFYRV